MSLPDRKPFREVDRKPFVQESQNQTRSTDIEVKDSGRLESLLSAETTSMPETMDKQLEKRDELLGKKSKLAEQVILERRIDWLRQSLGEKNDLLESLDNVDYDELDVGDKRTLHKMLEEEIEKSEDAVDQKGEQEESDSTGDTIIGEVNIDQSERINDIDVSSRKRILNFLEDKGFVE